MKNKTHQEVVNQYNERLDEFLMSINNMETISNHIKHICVSVMFHRDGILNGGGFVTTIVNNDLRGSIKMADKECYAHLKLIVNVCSNCYVE